MSKLLFDQFTVTRLLIVMAGLLMACLSLSVSAQSCPDFNQPQSDIQVTCDLETMTCTNDWLLCIDQPTTRVDGSALPLGGIAGYRWFFNTGSGEVSVDAQAESVESVSLTVPVSGVIDDGKHPMATTAITIDTLGQESERADTEMITIIFEQSFVDAVRLRNTDNPSKPKRVRVVISVGAS